jgi:GTP-binding protein Era
MLKSRVQVDKDSQKAILIGRGGERLKALGTQARLRLEEFLQRKVRTNDDRYHILPMCPSDPLSDSVVCAAKVFLSLYVKVDNDWRRNKDALAKFGYIDSDFG